MNLKSRTWKPKRKKLNKGKQLAFKKWGEMNQGLQKECRLINMMKLEDGRNWFNMSKKVEDSWLWWIYGWITVFSLWRVMEGSGWSAKWPQYTNFQTMTVAESVALVTNVPSKTVCFMCPLGLGHSFFFSNYASTSVLLSAEDF